MDRNDRNVDGKKNGEEGKKGERLWTETEMWINGQKKTQMWTEEWTEE